MKMMKYSIAAIVFTASQLAAAAGGDTWRYTGASYKTEAFSQAQFWTDNNGTGNVGASGAPLESDDYYIVANWKVFWTTASQTANTTYTFGGKRLTLGEIGKGKTAGYMEVRTYTATTIAKFPDDGVVLANGYMKARGYKDREHPIDAKLTVTAPASAPFSLGARNSYPDQTLTLKGELIGDSTTGLIVKNFIDNDFATNVIVKLACDCSQYYGSITVTGLLDRTMSQFGAALSLTSIAMPGSVTVNNNGILRTAANTDIAELGSLTLNSGSCIALQAGTVSGNVTNGFFRVTDSFSATGPVAVTIPYTVVPIDGTSRRFPVLEVPLESVLSTNDFAVEFSSVNDDSPWPLEWLHFEVEEDEMCKRLVLVSEPVVYQILNDSDTYSPGYGSALTNEANWYGGILPRQGYNHLVYGRYSKLLRSLSDVSLDYVFPGDSLSVCRYTASRGASFMLFCRSFYVPFFHCVSSSIASGSLLPVCILRADKMQFSGTTNFVTVQIGGYMEFDGPIYGSGVIMMKGNNTYGSNGRVWLNGDNSNFKGKIGLSVGSATPNDTDIFQTLYVANGNNLGGALDEFAYDALSLEAYAVLCTTNGSVTLESGLNRGLYVNDVARIRAEAGHTLTVNWPLTLNGTLRKEGEGNLLLGGDALFTPVDGVPAATPTADANIVAVKAGGIGVNAAKSLNGMALQFEPGGKLICNADATDADLKARGLVNTKAATPFAVLADAGKIPVDIVSEDMPTEGNFTLAVLTVPSAQAESVQAMMGRVKVPAAWKGYRAVWTDPVVDAESGETTLRVSVRMSGFKMYMR